MRQLPGPTWRRLKSCLEYRHRQVPVPTTGPEDRLKTLGLLLGLARGEEKVLKDEMLQLSIGREGAGAQGETAVQDEIHRLAGQVALEKWIR